MSDIRPRVRGETGRPLGGAARTQEPRSSPCVAAYGELVYDHVFTGSGTAEMYLGGRGGGTAWNVLANLACGQTPCIAIGAYGLASPYGELALRELAAYGISVENLEPLRGKATRLIFQRERPPGDHSFGMTCPVCGKAPTTMEDSLARTALKRHPVSVDWRATPLLLFDRLSPDRTRLLSAARRGNPSLVGVLDLHNPSQLRFRPGAAISGEINRHDLVFLSRRMLRSLEKRLDLTSPFDLIADPTTLRALVVLAGPEGLQILDATHESENFRSLAAPAVKAIADSAGAGDVVIALAVSGVCERIARGETEAVGIEPIVKSLADGVSEIERVLAHHGARGHLGHAPSEPPPTEAFVGRQLGEIRDQVLRARDRCPFCWEKPDSRPRKAKAHDDKPRRDEKSPTSSGTILAGLRDKILFLPERRTAIKRLQDEVLCHRTYVCVGTGGSYPAAAFVSRALEETRERFSTLMHPYEYYRTTHLTPDCLVILSHSGSTKDCGLALCRARDHGVSHVAVITQSKRPALGALARSLGMGCTTVSYGNGIKNGEGHERGFLSFAGTILPAVLFACAIEDGLGASPIGSICAILNDAERWSSAQLGPLLQSARESGRIDVFGGYEARPAMLDIEAKFVEGGVCAVQQHESKDFSHGRFMLVMGKTAPHAPKIMLQAGEDPYELALADALAATTATPFVRMRTPYGGLLGSLALLTEVQFLMKRVAMLIREEEQGRDICRPRRIPRQGLELYRWGSPPPSE